MIINVEDKVEVTLTVEEIIILGQALAHFAKSYHGMRYDFGPAWFKEIEKNTSNLKSISEKLRDVMEEKYG